MNTPGLNPAERRALADYLAGEGLGAYPELVRPQNDLTTPPDPIDQAIGIVAESADPARVQPQRLIADTTTIPDLTRVFPTFITAAGGFRSLAINLTGTCVAPQVGLRRLVSIEPEAFQGQGLIIGSIRAEMVSTDNLGGLAVAWGDANGLGAAIVAGFGLPCNDDDRMYPATIAFPGAGDINAPAVSNATQLSWGTTFPPGSAATALGVLQGQKATIGEDWPPFVQRIVEGQRFTAAFALRADQATAANGDVIAGYAFVRVRLALINTQQVFSQGVPRT